MLKTSLISVSALLLGIALVANAQTGASAPTKVGIIHIQNAILSTKDGQKAASDLQAQFAPKKAELDKLRQEIAQAQDQYRKGANTMSDVAREKLTRDIDQKTKELNRHTEDAQAELDQAQNKIMQELGQRMMAVITKYAKDHGFSLILDVSSPQTPVLYAANEIDITRDIIELYDQNSPSTIPTSVKPPAATKTPAKAAAAPKK